MKCVTQSLLAVLLLLSTSCATMFAEKTAAVRFTSKPTGATVTAGSETGVTPVVLKLGKDVSTVTFKHPSHPPRELHVDKGLGFGWFLMDVLFTPGFGIVGIVVDGSSGAWSTLPETIHCDFTVPQKTPPKKKSKWVDDDALD